MLGFCLTLAGCAARPYRDIVDFVVDQQAAPRSPWSTLVSMRDHNWPVGESRGLLG